MFDAKAYSAASPASPLASTVIARRDPTPTNVQIEIIFCGVCHSDLHMARNEWGDFFPTAYPCVPAGHDINAYIQLLTRAFRGSEGVPPGHWREANREPATPEAIN